MPFKKGSYSFVHNATLLSLIKHQLLISSCLSYLLGSLNKFLFGLSGELLMVFLLFPLLDSVGGSLEVIFVLAIFLQRSKLTQQKHLKLVYYSVVAISKRFKWTIKNKPSKEFHQIVWVQYQNISFLESIHVYITHIVLFHHKSILKPIMHKRFAANKQWTLL